MSGETDLARMIATMRPTLKPQRYAFISITQGEYGEFAELQPVAMVAEQEGMTLVVPVENAMVHNISFDGVYRCITLSVHSSLEAVGLTAAFSHCLSEQNISANVIAGFYHDHIFVPESDATRAVEALERLSAEHK